MDMKIEDRMLILHKAMRDIQNYFAHWKSIPDIQVDELYKEFVKQAIKTDDRYEFAILMKEFMAKFKNTHTWYGDSILWGEYIPFHVMYHDYEKRWVVLSSRNKEIMPGTVIERIDKEKVEDFYKCKKGNISASSDRIARNLLFESYWLFPKQFSITTEDNRTVKIRRHNLAISYKKVTARIIKDDIAYISIPTFNTKEAVDATEYVRKFKSYKKLIIDLRNNRGGNTPIQLLKSLMNKRYSRFCYTKVIPKDATSIMAHVDRGQKLVRSYKTENADYKRPIKNPYSGKLVMLINQVTMSAAEDFLFPFKDNKRAKVIGIQTAGSNGDTYIDSYKKGIYIGVGSVIVTFPNGSKFEGIGIKPDEEVYPSIKDIKNGNDIILERAIKSLKST
jgi:carboxyl-terminal processing protease